MPMTVLDDKNSLNKSDITEVIKKSIPFKDKLKALRKKR